MEADKTFYFEGETQRSGYLIMNNEETSTIKFVNISGRARHNVKSQLTYGTGPMFV